MTRSIQFLPRAALRGGLASRRRDCREICTQVLLSCLLTPYEIATSMLGFRGAGLAAGLIGEMEGNIVEMSQKSKDLEAPEEPPAKASRMEHLLQDTRHLLWKARLFSCARACLGR